MKNRMHTYLGRAFFSLLFLISMIIYSACEWFHMRFGVSFEGILFTITSPMKGSDISFLSEAVNYVLVDMIPALVILTLVLLFASILKRIQTLLSVKVWKWEFHCNLHTLYRIVCITSTCLLLIHSICSTIISLGVDEYVARKGDTTTIYEDYYVNPNEITISNTENPKNLIMIYLESMEITYASKELGGNQDINYIPNLSKLAEENVSFSNNAALGGANVTTGSGWTMGALFSTTTGVPFSLPIEGNSMDTFEKFTPGITSLGDILKKQGYNQVFLCGSDSVFGGRKNYFEQHGDYEIIDYYDMIDKNYIDEDYFVWWGAEDRILYEVAKTELLELAKQDAPFNFTMLTVDTHHVDGFVCDICRNTYSERLANVVQCADQQILNFVNWCKKQDFYEDTTIVIVGDHPRMDSSLVKDFDNRTMYNCFINSAKTPAASTKNRTFTTLDVFPTTLSSMGFEIKGNHLGLGTDLFSDSMTLSEEIGFQTLNTELMKYSPWYIENFQ